MSGASPTGTSRARSIPRATRDWLRQLALLSHRTRVADQQLCAGLGKIRQIARRRRVGSEVRRQPRPFALLLLLERCDALPQLGVLLLKLVLAHPRPLHQTQEQIRAQDKRGQVIPAQITVFEDRSFTFILKTPPAADLLRKAAGVEKGSGLAKRETAGRVSREQVRQIAETKMADLNANDIEAAMKHVEGTARSMGIEVVQ